MWQCMNLKIIFTYVNIKYAYKTRLGMKSIKEQNI